MESLKDSKVVWIRIDLVLKERMQIERKCSDCRLNGGMQSRFGKSCGKLGSIVGVDTVDRGVQQVILVQKRLVRVLDAMKLELLDVLELLIDAQIFDIFWTMWRLHGRGS